MEGSAAFLGSVLPAYLVRIQMWSLLSYQYRDLKGEQDKKLVQIGALLVPPLQPS